MTKPARCSTCALCAMRMTQPSASKGSEVIFLGISPEGRVAFKDYGGTLVRGLLRDHENPLVKKMEPRVGFSYAVWCKPEEDENLKKSTVSHCRDNMSMDWLERIKPKVILAFGGQDLAAFFGTSSQKKGDMRGTVYKHRWKTGGKSIVIFTVSLTWLAAKPGLASIVSNDIATAAHHYNSTAIKPLRMSQLDKLYDTPIDLQDTIESINELYQYDGGSGVEQTLMSLDTETNTLFPWWSEAKIISVSAAVSRNKALSFAVDHKDSQYSLEDIAPWLIKLTMSEHPKAWWNYKFDAAMFRVAFTRRLKQVMTPGLSADITRISGRSWDSILQNNYVNNTRWDGQLGEHLLDEDKAGFYSLKSVVLDYLPELHGYEDSLKAVLDSIEEDRLSNIELTLGELSLADLNIHSNWMDGDTALMDIKREFDSAKKKIRSRVRGFRAQGRERAREIEEGKLKEVATAYSALRREVLEGKKKYKEDIYSKKVKVAGEVSLWTYEDVPIDTLLLYGAIDAAATVHISKIQRKKLYSQNSQCIGKTIFSLMDRHCLPLSTLFSDIQAEGVYVDTGYTRQLQKTLAEASTNLEKSIICQLEKDFPNMGASTLNFKSDRDLANILCAWYGLPILEQTAKGLASMKGEHLATYRDVHNSAIAGMLIDYSTVNKAKSDFVDKFLYLSSYDGKLHGEYLLHGTATGRASGRNPNLTNVPAKVRALGKEYIVKKCIISTPIDGEYWWESPENRSMANRYSWEEGEDLVIVDADLSGAEVRVLTRYAQDQGLIQAIINGLDVHSWITSEVHGIPYDDISTLRKEDTPEGRRYDELRDGTKGVVFKILYGGTPEDKALMDTIFNRFPAIPEYMREAKKRIFNNKILVTPNGRPRRFPLVRLSNKIERRNYRQGINFYVQSYCSDIVMSVLGNIYRNLHKLRGRLMLTVHDSIVFEVPSSELSRVNAFLNTNITEYIASEFPDVPVPMTYGFKVGKNYGEMSKL
jgi:DNA polymerase I-like protein with 3'-5' exonuclease and polymerase domains/uracil-DNA glycosylase